MKRGKYAKFPAKIQVRGIYHIQDIQRNILPKFIEICMWCCAGAHPGGHTNMVDRNINCYLVLLQKREYIPWGTHSNIKVILFLIHELFR